MRPMRGKKFALIFFDLVGLQGKGWKEVSADAGVYVF